MINLVTNEHDARRYTTAVLEYLDNYYKKEDIIFELFLTALYWLSDDDVKRFAEVNLDVVFDSEEED